MQNSLDQEQSDADRFLAHLTALSRKKPMRDPATALIEERGFTPSQLHTLVWIGLDGPLTMGELAQRLAISDKTITGVVDRLERAALVLRLRDEQDRRVVRVGPTQEGADLFEVLWSEVRKKAETFLGILEPQELAMLFGVLERLAKAPQPPLSSEEVRPEP